jgi:hypothetical protein
LLEHGLETTNIVYKDVLLRALHLEIVISTYSDA